MSFLGNLAKGFVRSAVNQVGRDGGKVISNKIYKGTHGTPVYNSGVTVNDGFETISIDHIDSSIQPEIDTENPAVALIKGTLIQIIPIVGFVVSIKRGIENLSKKTAPIYVVIPNKIRDKRYKEGYRIDGLVKIQSNNIRLLSDSERSRAKLTGWAYILSIPLFYAACAIWLMNNETPTTTKQGVVSAKHGLHLRDQPSQESNVFLTIPASDTVKVLEGSDSLNAGWLKVEYKENSGWVSKEYIKEI
jgi:hypothetical protein